MADSCSGSTTDGPWCIHAIKINYIVASSLFCFDYLLTSTREMRLIWFRRRVTSASFLFLATRYTALLNCVFVIISLNPSSDKSDQAYVTTSSPQNTISSRRSCARWTRIQMSLDVILLTSAAVFSGLRVYALCSLRWWIFAVVTLLGMTCPAIIAYTVTEMRDNVVDFSPYARACYYTAKISNVRFESWIIGARVSSLVADSLVVTVTAVRTLRVSSPFKGSFSSILFCDGAMYFIVLLSANIAGLGLIRHFNFIEPMGMWISILTSIMTSRFILDLLGANDALRGTLPTPGTSVVFCSPQQDKSVYETFIPGMSDEEAFDDGWEPSESCDTNPELEGQSSTVYSQYSDWIDVSDRELELPVY